MNIKTWLTDLTSLADLETSKVILQNNPFVNSACHPNDIQSIEIIKPNLDTGPWIAGGAALRWFQNKPVGATDIDVFCASRQQFDNVISSINRTLQPEIVSKTDNAVTYKVETIPKGKWVIQVIKKKFYNSAQEVIDQFDISVCKIVTDGNRFILGDYTAADIRTKTLRMNDPFTESSLKRFVKYVSYGYRPVPGLYDRLITSENMATQNFDDAGDYGF